MIININDLINENEIDSYLEKLKSQFYNKLIGIVDHAVWVIPSTWGDKVDRSEAHVGYEQEW